MKNSHAADRALTNPTFAQLKELCAQIERGKISRDQMQYFLRIGGESRLKDSASSFFKLLGYNQVHAAGRQSLDAIDGWLIQYGEVSLKGEDSDTFFFHESRPDDQCFQLILAMPSGDILTGERITLALDRTIRLECKCLEIGKESGQSAAVSLDINTIATPNRRPRAILYQPWEMPFRWNWCSVSADTLAELRRSTV